ncbi:MAG: general secretion pathway protein GspK [Candidatus Omnitrophica bacterium]|nr:general secretion pathway protein GspK [Candidatus Omnitrophota bacterium]
MKKNNAQITVLGLWILIILTLLAIAIGQRVQFALGISRYQKDKLKADLLAKTAVNLAIAELESDASSDYDTLQDNWAEDVERFKKITLNGNPSEYASISYNIDKQYFGLVDEGRKINLNTAPRELLIALFSECGMMHRYAEDLADYVCVWRGDNNYYLNSNAEVYRNFKKSPFVRLEELVIVASQFYKDRGYYDYQRMARQLYMEVKDYVTVYSVSIYSYVNVNTVTKRVLLMLARSQVKSQEEMDCIEPIVEDILKQRSERGYFKNLDKIKLRDVVSGTSADETLFANLKSKFILYSRYFTIETQGYSGKVIRRIKAIYDRTTKNMVCWYEN